MENEKWKMKLSATSQPTLSLVDRPQTVREGEELDPDRLFAYLSQEIPNLNWPLTIEQFPHGFSNLTYLIRTADRELVLRRPPVGAKIKTAHDMGREYRILSHLHPVYAKAPRPLWFCPDESIIGAPFYVMERVKGIILRSEPPNGLLLSPEVMRRLSETFIESLVEIHSVDYQAAGLSDLGQPHGYIARQIDGWTKRYHAARTDDVPAIERLISWLSANAPSDSGRGALIHNDYKYDNLVLATDDLSRVTAVLDWEMATIGDPLMDLGTSLAYWIEPNDPEDWQKYGFGLTRLPGSFTRSEVVEHYTKSTRQNSSDFVFYYSYGLLKVAVIVQQIFFRYRKGLTRDPRFSNLGSLVIACGNLAQRAIEKGRIDNLG